MCEAEVGDGSRQLAAHLEDRASHSDGQHVMWLNRNVTKQRVDVDALATLLDELFATGATRATKVDR